MSYFSITMLLKWNVTKLSSFCVTLFFPPKWNVTKLKPFCVTLFFLHSQGLINRLTK